MALSVQLPDYRLLFIGSHFAAHDNKVERRNADFSRIKAGLFNSSSSSLAELGASGGTFAASSGARTPGLGGTLQQGGQADADGIRRGSRSQGCRAELLGGNASLNSSSMRQTGSPRSPMVGWLSGVWDAAGSQQAGSWQDGSCGSASASPGSGFVVAPQQDSVCSCSEVCNLRAASCPPCRNHFSEQLAVLPAVKTGTASLKGRPSITPACSTPDATLSPRSADYGQAASQYSAGGDSGSVRFERQREASFVEELQQQLNTFKSFVFRRTSANLLGSR